MGLTHVRAALIARAFTALLLATVALPMAAHELGLVQVEVSFQRDGTYAVDFLVDAEHLPPDTSGLSGLLRDLQTKSHFAFDGHAVSLPAGEVTQVKALTRLRLQGRTPSNVSSFTFSSEAIPDFFVLRLRSEGRGETSTQWLESGKPSAPFALDRAVVPLSRWSIIKLYLVLGYTHILPRGLDHVLFVLGIFLLAAGLRPVLWQVSAFTIAHTITLGLTIYGVVSLPPRIVEPLIAVSIVYVAVENLFTSRLHAWRPLIVFCFGLLHGMGFAGVLREIGLPRSEFVPALLAFNAGVEGGQLTVIAAAVLLLGLPFRRKSWYRQRVVIPGSLIIAAIGLYWTITRVWA